MAPLQLNNIKESSFPCRINATAPNQMQQVPIKHTNDSCSHQQTLSLRQEPGGISLLSLDLYSAGLRA